MSTESSRRRQIKIFMIIAKQCGLAAVTGKPITVCMMGHAPKGFVRSAELLSIGTNGSYNYSVDPMAMLKWLRKQIVISEFELRHEHS